MLNLTKSFFLLPIAILTIALACNPTTKSPVIVGNPPALGFNESGSDAQAIAIADEVMEAMGGRAAWDKTDRLFWNFFGGRTLDWNKADNTVKIHLLKDSTIIDLDMNNSTGSVVIKGKPLVGKDTIDTYLDRAKKIWINDSYWLVMPFKMKDSGVTLKYVSRDTTASGLMGDKLSLTFDGVGVTPQNKYEIIVTDENRLVEEWRFYTNATDSIPRFATPWAEYKKYGDILLSGDRGRNKLSEIAVGYPND